MRRNLKELFVWLVFLLVVSLTLWKAVTGVWENKDIIAFGMGAILGITTAMLFMWKRRS